VLVPLVRVVDVGPVLACDALAGTVDRLVVALDVSFGGGDFSVARGVATGT
jgi:hypothetical protein